MRYTYSILIFYVFIVMYTIPKDKNNCDLLFNFSTTKPVIIFDLINVVIQENQSEFTKKIGYGKLASYTLTHWKNPGYRCLDMLQKISSQENQKPHCTVKLQERIIPRCLVELQEGKKSCEEVKTEIMQSIEELDKQKYFSGIKEKNLMIHIMELVLDPAVAENMIEPIKPTLQLIEQLKSKGYTVYLFANAPKELYSAMQRKHRKILNLFDGIILSCEVQTLKPNLEIFNHLIEKHNLNPQQCILIDDLPETATTAKQLGMHPIVFNKINQVKKELKKLGVKI